MTRSRRSNTTRRTAAFKWVTALALAAAAGACDSGDSMQRTLDAAGVKMESLASAGSNAVAPVKFRKDEYSRLVKELGPIADSSDAGHALAANMILARAKAGLAEISAADAAGQEQGFLSQITIARAELNQWISQQSTAASLSAYDPAKDLAELDKQAAEKFAEAGRYQADKTKQEGVVAEIRGRADQARAAARTERDREAAIRKQAEGMSQTAREQMIVQAVEASRKADAHERQAAELAAEAAKEAPKVDEIANVVDRLQKQVDSLKKTKESIQARAAVARKHSDEAVADANTVGTKLASTLQDLVKIREAAATPTQEAVRLYNDAAKAAKKASATTVREAKVAATAANGGYQQALGDVLAAKARSLSVYAATLEAVAKSTPTIPNTADISSRATAARTDLEGTTKEAEAAYTEAQNLYGKTGAAGDLKNRMEQVTKTLKELQDLRTPPAPAPVPAPAPGEEKPAAETKPAAAAPAAAAEKPALAAEQSQAVEAEVRAAVKEIAEAGKADDMAKLLAHFDFASDAEKKVVESAIPMKQSLQKLNAAAQEKFGKPIGDLVKDSKSPAIKSNPLVPMLTALGKKDAIMEGDADKLAVKAESATEATISMDGAPGSTRFVKKDGVWKITGVGALMGGPMATQIAPMFKTLSDSFDAVTGSIKSGTYADADAMLTDLSAKLMGAMGGMMGGNRPKPGG